MSCDFVYVVLALGSNMGSKVENIERAYDKLEENGIGILAKSSLHFTKAYGYEDQDDFVNSVILCKTIFFPSKLLIKMKEIEKNIGRSETFHWGPRVLDIDVIFYDNIFYHSDSLIIPHVDYKNRSFVLEPMCEIKNEIVSCGISLNIQYNT